MAELSEFQKKKLLHVFNTFYDVNGDGVVDWNDFKEDIDVSLKTNVNGDGVIDWNDFNDDIQKLAKLLGWADGSDAKKKAETTLKAIWDDLRKFADKNQDDQISKDEWLKMWNDNIKKKDSLPGWVTRYMEFMFTVNDGNGDDVIDVDEYTSVFTKYGISEADCKKAFDVITNGGTVRLTLEEYNKLWQDYFLSADEKARGNSLFGAC